MKWVTGDDLAALPDGTVVLTSDGRPARKTRGDFSGWVHIPIERRDHLWAEHFGPGEVIWFPSEVGPTYALMDELFGSSEDGQWHLGDEDGDEWVSTPDEALRRLVDLWAGMGEAALLYRDHLHRAQALNRGLLGVLRHLHTLVTERAVIRLVDAPQDTLIGRSYTELAKKILGAADEYLSLTESGVGSEAVTDRISTGSPA